MIKQDRQGARTPAQLEQKYNFGETFSKTNESQSKQTSQLNQLTQAVAQFVADTNAEIENLKETIAGAQMVSNALEGKASGERITLEDVSPIKHLMTIKLSGEHIPDLRTVELGVCGETDEYTYYEPKEDGTVEGVLSLYPITKLSTDTEGVMIEVTYNRDLNKAFAELIASNERG